MADFVAAWASANASSIVVLQASTAENSCPTVVPMPWYSVIVGKLPLSCGTSLVTVDGIQRHCRKRSGGDVVLILVERLAGTVRHVCSTLFRCHHLGILLVRGPGDELLGRIDLLRSGRNEKGP